ncbi:hypothetical protein E0Z10_g852 [Xylaria hypoxylon]|uniref:Uncharacterized protein n=1 Tax=Xylaria hypoxylon TaxID=37992 RepID=A0A4Z0ZAE0_9PEZI|nr:hypothetical protein E0Z10_g852 [Xylaria hypoxylon]
MSGALAIWLCNGLVTCLILARLGLRKWRQFTFTMGDWWLVVALIFNGLRVIGDYYTNKHGTPLTYVVEGESTELEMTAEEQNSLVLAGKLMIATRIAIVVVSYDALWIITYEISNIITDTMLFFQPILLILGASISKWERAWLSLFGFGAILVFGLGAVLIAVEITRLVEGLPFTNIILNRIVWGSVEVVIAASVATLPTIYVLLRLGFEGRQKEDRKKTHGDPGALAATPNATREPAQDERRPLQHIDIWDDRVVVRDNMPTSAETGAEHNTSKPLLWNSIQSSIISSILSSALAGGSNRDSWPKFRSRLRNPFQSSGTRSRISSRMRGANDDHHDARSGWIELEEVDMESVAGEATSPEPDDAAYRSGGVFIATEINQEVHRAWEIDQRPRIVTIPRRAKIDRTQV